MLRVYTCIAHQHNFLFVVIAGMICLLATLTALSAFQQAVREASRRATFIIVAALVSGLGIWSTHFIAMLAYEPGLSISYDVSRTLLSVLAAVVICGIGWTVALGKRPFMAPLGGAIIGGGVGTMHYLGMSAVKLAGYIIWDHNLVAASLILGIGLSAMAAWLQRRESTLPVWAAGSVLALGICSLHFVAMAAAVIYPLRTSGVAVQSLDSQSLAIGVTVAALSIMGVGAGLVMFDRRLAAAQLAEARQRAALADQIVHSTAERNTLIEKLRYQVEISTAALDNMAQGLSMYDSQNRLITHNRRYAELYGINEELLTPGTPVIEIWERVVADGTILQSRSIDIPVIGDEDWLKEHEVTLSDGRIIKFQRQPLPAGGWVATHEDVTEARRTNQQIAYLAAHDALTGLPNRATFSTYLEAYAKDGKAFAVHTIDLDRFKEVNDTLGHAVGDEILRSTAVRLLELTGENDVVTRLGGDEFAVLQWDVDGLVTPAAFADRIVKRLAEPFEFKGHTVIIGASVGISLAPESGICSEELLMMSDLALYCAKDESRGTYRFFERGMDSRLCERRQLEEDLRVAITEGQFEVYYQPLLDVSKGTITSFEALVRWHHPTRGLVQPADFIATAEDTGLIIPIGEWVLRQACRDAINWPNDVGVAVNVSPAQFKRGDLIAMTMSALTAAGLAPERLELEITEAVLLHDEAWVQAALKRIAALGVRIAMDDFGTGYSSLSYLRAFPFNKIKIDRSFIADIVGKSDALSIVQATIQLSQKLGMEITAEGVETAEQMNVLVEEGCTTVQGYHISRPIPVSRVAELLRLYNTGVHTSARAAG